MALMNLKSSWMRLETVWGYWEVSCTVWAVKPFGKKRGNSETEREKETEKK